MDAELRDISRAVQMIAAHHGTSRRNELQRLIGQPTEDAMLLHRRALLMTRLREAKVWGV